MSHQCPIAEVPQNLSWILPSSSKVDLSHEEVEAAVEEYLARGGMINTLPPQQEFLMNEIPANSAYERLDFLHWNEDNEGFDI